MKDPKDIYGVVLTGRFFYALPLSESMEKCATAWAETTSNQGVSGNMGN